MAAWEDAREGWLEMVLAKESRVGILDVGDGFEYGAEREARDWGHVVVGKKEAQGVQGR